MKRGFDISAYRADYIENADETHSIFNMDNGRTVYFRAQEEECYEDVVSGYERTTTVVRFTGGRNAHIVVPMLVVIMRIVLLPDTRYS